MTREIIDEEEVKTCEWCKEDFAIDELSNTDLGHLCDTCIRAIQSRGEEVIIYTYPERVEEQESTSKKRQEMEKEALHKHQKLLELVDNLDAGEYNVKMSELTAIIAYKEGTYDRMYESFKLGFLRGQQAERERMGGLNDEKN